MLIYSGIKFIDGPLPVLDAVICIQTSGIEVFDLKG
jgi:hypothetical protein